MFWSFLSWQLMFNPLSGFCDVHTQMLGQVIGTGERVWYTIIGPNTCLSLLDVTRGVGRYLIFGGREALGALVGVTRGRRVGDGPWYCESDGGGMARWFASPGFRLGQRSCLISCVTSLPCSLNGVSQTISPTKTEIVSSQAFRGIRSQVQFHGFSSSWISIIPPICSRTPANGSIFSRFPLKSKWVNITKRNMLLGRESKRLSLSIRTLSLFSLLKAPVSMALM